MKKLLLSVGLGVTVLTASAQKFNKVETPYVLGKFEEAKTEIGKIAADAKYQSNPEVWFWHATVYGALADNEVTAPRYPDAKAIALNSFRKYGQLDPSFKAMNENSIPGKAVVDILYRANLKEGISYFDAKKWDSAFKYFVQSAEIGDLITKYDWRGNKQALDTITVLFSGFAAQNAKKNEEAAKYYTRIADLKITNIPATGDVKDVYEYLVFHYMQTKNTEKFNRFIALAKELYPKETLWNDYEAEYIEFNYTLAEKLAAYDKADAAGTLTSNQYLSYGNMFYNLKEEDREKMDSTQLRFYRDKAEDAFGKAFGKDNKNGLAAYNAGLLNYNDWVEMDDKFEANIKKIAELNRNKNAGKDPKKKAALEAKTKKDVDALRAANAEIEKKQHASANKGIQWMENAHAALSGKANPERNEKNVLSKSVDYLANFYIWKRDKSKGNNAEYDKYDALYKKYDALHGKYN